MSPWKKRTAKSETEVTLPAALQVLLDELANLISVREELGEVEVYLWQTFVDNLRCRCGDLPDPEGTATLATSCVQAGRDALTAMYRTRLWERLLPKSWTYADLHRHKAAFERRVRLGVFYAACMQYLLPILCTARVELNGKRWMPLHHTFSEFAAGQETSQVDIAWDDSPLHAGDVHLMANLFLGQKELLRDLPRVVAREVLSYLRADCKEGLFATMLSDPNDAEEQDVDVVDVAALFLETLRRAVQARRLRLNSIPGDLFVTRRFSFLVTPAATDLLIGRLRAGSYSFTRVVVYRALGTAGYLYGVPPDAKDHTRLAQLTSPSWRRPIRLRGLTIAHNALWAKCQPPPFLEGKVTLEG